GSVDPRPYYAGWIRWVKAFVPKTTGPDVSRPLADYVGYDTVPVGGVAEVMKLIAHVKDDLPVVECPILIVHGQHAGTVPLANAREIHDTVSSHDKKLVILPRSQHVVTLDVEHEVLEAEVIAFVARHRKTWA
ncbi:MAG: alpha/beta hydrolase, partial [Chloroflexota bacterium]